VVFSHREAALMIAVVLAGISVAVFLASSIQRVPGHHQVVVPSLLAWPRRSRTALLRHLPMLLFAAGIPFFFAALADPYSAMAERQVSYPGRRIGLVLDASSSMMVPFESTRLRKPSPNEAAFLTTVAAAEAFVRQRKNGRYRDLVALVEFGDEAYVITPFTSDYDNVLLSMSLIGDWGEYMQFPDGGTDIGRAIDRATGLFKAFNFLDAAGNVMVIFSDGEDTQVTRGANSLKDVLDAAVAAKIPVYLIRTRKGKRLGDMIPDAIWKPSVEATGGRFYAAATEEDVIRAIREIDDRSAGTIEMKQYAVRQPRFVAFASLTGAFWAVSLLMKVTVPYFNRFP
jgi:hypothetical protein